MVLSAKACAFNSGQMSHGASALNTRNTSESWGLVMRALHWLMAVLFLLQLTIGWIAGQMARSPAKIDVMTGHKSLGISLLILAVVRLIWRLLNPRPQALEGTHAWEARVSQMVHISLYFLLFALPLSGWLAASTSIVPWKFWWMIPWPKIADPDPALHEMAETAHNLLIWFLLGLLALHIGAALRHHFIKRNRVLLRMWKGSPLLLLVATTGPCQAAEDRWQSITARSELQFIAYYENQPLEGRFGRFIVSLSTDEKSGQPALLRVEVDVTSADMNDREINDELSQADWFDSGTFPQAIFASHSIVQISEGQFTARGALTLKGIELALDVPFNWQAKENSAEIGGSMQLSRLAWKIGLGEWSGEDIIADTVQLKFKVDLGRGD